jgi:beta-phosphoglucomutase
MFEAVIFDFDGVILNSEPIHYQACFQAFTTLGIKLDYAEYVEKYLGLADKEMFLKFLAERGLQYSDAERDALIACKVRHYQNLIHLDDNLPMIDDVDHYISHLSKTVRKIAICSGSTRKEITTILTKLKQGALQPYFDLIVTADDVRQGKPSPEGYLLTAKHLNVSPEKCLVIEDTPHGVAAAKAAGMYAVALLTTYQKHQFQHADKVIDGFKQLMLV